MTAGNDIGPVSYTHLLIKPFKLLDKASVPRGKGAIICMKETLSAVDSDNYIVPIWMI